MLVNDTRRGFTLTELLVVVAIAGLLLAMAGPALYGMVVRQRVIASAHAFFHGAAVTRADAIRQGRPVIMRPLQGDDWASGWRIGDDPARSLSHPALPPGITVDYVAGGQVLGYRATGQPMVRGRWRFTHGDTSRVVVINFLGRVRMCDPAAESSCASG